ncbi:MAG: carbamoyltransferase [Candidatus Tectimicrobiota bacterium]|nr:MAG: carbamoyltransferase [Candidatus Tectomicrobia bacterium]
MNILGLGDHVSCGSAILRDGVFTAVVTDERLVREKMVFGVPRLSIAKVMELSGLGPQDIDRVAIATINQHLINRYVDFRGGWFGLDRGRVKQTIFDVASVLSRAVPYAPFLPRLYYLVRQPFYAHRRRMLRHILRHEFGIQAPVVFIDHHYCHATSAYYSSGFDAALVVTIDGGGDGVSSRVYDVQDGRFRLLHTVPSYHSLGVFYSYITQICGFKAGRHEGKITGLAAHGTPRYLDILRQFIAYENGTFKNIGNVFFHSALRELRRRLPADFDRADLAASVQHHTEALVVQYVQHWLKRSGRSKVALAGGLFANVAVNRRVHEIPGVEEVFIHPGMSDEGMPVGAALAAYYDHGETRPEKPRLCMEHVYLGPEFSDEEIRQELARAGIAAEYHPDIERVIAAKLAEGYVVARFNGRMEYGPRALGNRSILYQPTDPSVNDWLNHALQRTEFMPFAPSTLAEEAGRCYLHLEGAENTARFMTITFACTPWMRAHCPGVIHVDGTARPQLVRPQDNPSFYAILREYYRLTGLPSVINTSFNMHEEPIVCTPADAIRAFQLGHLDYLAIGHYLARNPAPLRRPLRPSPKVSR